MGFSRRSLSRHALALFCLGLSALAHSGDTATAGLRVGLMHSEPWAYYSRDGGNERKSQLSGVFVDISRELARETGLSLELNTLPYGRVGKELQSGDCDLTYLIRSDDRDAYVEYAGYLFSFHTLVMARPGSALRSYDDLQGLRIGLVKDIRLSPRFDGDAGLNKVEVRDYETLVDMFLSGRLDAIAGNSISLHHLLQKRGYPSQPWPRLMLQKTEVWAQMSKKSPQLGHLPRIRSAVEKLRGEGFFENAVQRYRPAAESAPQAKRSTRERETAVSLTPTLSSR